MGEILEKVGQADGARERYTLSLRLDPAHPRAKDAQAALVRLGPPKPKEQGADLSELHVALLPFTPADERALEKALPRVRKALRVTLDLLPPPPEPLLTPDRLVREGQYDAGKLVEVVALCKAKDPNAASLFVGVTGEDIATDSTSFLFAQATEPCAVLSRARFRNEFYGLPPNAKRAAKRLSIQVVTSTARAMGLPSCSNPGCALAYPGSLEEFDKKSGTLCPDCLNLFEAYGFLRLGKPAECEKRLAARVVQHPRDAVAWYRLAKVRQGLGDRKGAAEAASKASGLCPKDPAPRKILEEVQDKPGE